MYKFFVEENQIDNNKIIIKGEDVNHIKNVLRSQEGENILICSKETSTTYKCLITKIDKLFIEANILELINETTETNTYIHIFQGLPKGDKLENIIEKCTEIGVKEITPIEMKRCVVKLDEKSKMKKLERWNKIAEVAAKQSKRDNILQVNEVINYKNIFQKLEFYDIVIVAYEEEKEISLKQVLKNINKKDNLKIAIIIGPEGGIDETEIADFKKAGAILVTLGKRILRTETAPLVVASNILYELEE